jgi:uncharacterized protein (DUF302 family)
MTVSPPTGPDDGILTKAVAGTVDETVTRLTDLVEARGMMTFTIIDHSGEAERAGLHLRDTKVVIFGSPASGTPIMRESPLTALDLPLKVLVWQDDGGTKVSYTDPDVLASRHRLTADQASRLAGIGPLTDALMD